MNIPPGIRSVNRLIAWTVLVTGLALSCIAYKAILIMHEQDAAARFDQRAKEAQYQLERQVNLYASALGSMQAHLHTYSEMSQRDFQRAVWSHTIFQRLPGVRTVGIAYHARPGPEDGRGAITGQALAQDDAGLASLKSPTSSSLFNISQVEAVGTSGNAVNLPPFSPSAHQEAMERSRDTGKLISSQQMAVMTGASNLDEVIFFLPLYRGGMVPESLAQRRLQNYGVTFLTIGIQELMRDGFSAALLDEVRVQIHHEMDAEPSRQTISDKNILFDSHPGARKLAENKAAPIGGYAEQLQSNKHWHLTVTALPDFPGTLLQWMPAIVGLSGGFVSVLLFLFMMSMTNRRRKRKLATVIAEKGQKTLAVDVERILKSLTETIWTIEVPSRKTIYVSAGVERLTNKPAQAFYDDPLLWFSMIHPGDQAHVLFSIDRIAHTIQEAVECRFVKPDGEIRWLRCHATFSAGPTAGTGTIHGITIDISEQRAIETALRRSKRALLAIRAFHDHTISANSESELYQGICDVMVTAGYRMAWAGILDTEGNGGIKPIGVAGENQDSLEYMMAAVETSALSNPAIEQALRSQKPVIVVENRMPSGSAPMSHLEPDCYSKIVIPLVHAGESFGLLKAYAVEENAFDAEEVDLLSSLAQSLMAAVQAFRNQNAFRDSEAALRLRQRAIEACANPIVITRVAADGDDAGNLVEYVNPAFERVTGYGANEVIGRTLDLLRRDDLDQPGLREIQSAFDEQRAGHAELREYHKDGSMFWSDVYIAPVRDDAGCVSHLVSVMYDITATKKYQADLLYQANYDMVTGLANRYLLQDRLEQAFAHAERYGHLVWVMLLDLDGFKSINASLGHQAGDQLLQKVAGRLLSTVRKTDTVARISGDKFALLMSGPNKNTAPVAAAVQRIMDAIGHPFELNEHEYFLTCSVGVALYPTDGGTAENLVKHADAALHQAKDLKRGNFQFYTPSMHENAVERLILQGSLRGAIERQEFTLHYQPQVSLSNGKIVSMEALIRWQHPKLGLISPANFIGIAEDTGLILPIGMWVMRTACLQTKALHDAGYCDLHIAVNLSARQFHQPDLVQSIMQILEETGLDPHFLTIELTESMVMTDVTQAVETLHQLKTMGLTLSIDDFGTGYSSLSYLNRFPVDYLKIDRSFIKNIITNPDMASIALSIISLAHSLRLQVVAEGVETLEQLAFLQRHRCDQIQGYYFSRPLAIESIRELLEEDRQLPLQQHAPSPALPTILILDDEINITSALARLLRREGYQILRAHTVEEAFGLLALHPVQVILTDQLMPGMTGTQFLTKVKGLYPDTMRIILSGYTGIDTIIGAINSGAVFRFHTKPWDDHTLRESIAEAFRLHWLMRKPESCLLAVETSEMLETHDQIACEN